jgi:peptidoglycan hydrolase CwlO-like protein
MIRLSFEYSGAGSAIEFIFSAEDFGDLLSRIDLLGYHLAYNDRVIENYSGSLENLEETKIAYENAKNTLTLYRDEQAARVVELGAKRAEA